MKRLEDAEQYNKDIMVYNAREINKILENSGREINRKLEERWAKPDPYKNTNTGLTNQPVGHIINVNTGQLETNAVTGATINDDGVGVADRRVEFVGELTGETFGDTEQTGGEEIIGDTQQIEQTGGEEIIEDTQQIEQTGGDEIIGDAQQIEQTGGEEIDTGEEKATEIQQSETDKQLESIVKRKGAPKKQLETYLNAYKKALEQNSSYSIGKAKEGLKRYMNNNEDEIYNVKAQMAEIKAEVEAEAAAKVAKQQQKKKSGK